MVFLSKIYTRTGDGGDTGLGDGTRVPKDHPRVAAYGSVDELNAVLGLLLVHDPGEGEADLLRSIQNDLFDVGADISVPQEGEKREHLRVLAEQTEWLEQRCDEVNANLEPLKSFVLPGGTPAAAQLHVCRTVCRRAERLAVACGPDINPETVRYLNRLSDLLFVLARVYNNHGRDDILWQPGKTQK